MEKSLIKYLKTLVIITLTTLFIVGCEERSTNCAPQNTSRPVNYEIVETENGYGYKIFVDGKLYISQPSIPGLSGTAGFESKADARKIAELAISKIKQGIIPPTITLEELKTSGIKLNQSHL